MKKFLSVLLMVAGLMSCGDDDMISRLFLS